MTSNRKLLLLCALVASAVAVPVSQREQCARHCTTGELSLKPGNTYTYDYETTTTTAVHSSSQDKSQIQLTAQVDVEVLAPCDLSLRLRGVTLKLSDPESPEYLNAIRGARDFARSLEKHILRFSYQDGKVEHVCPTENVPIWVSNIQKGILSAFQTQMLQPDWSTKVIETDVLGQCSAEYQSLGTSWTGTHTIRKLKDLNSCSNRENVETYLQGTPYMQEFQTKSLPLVKGNQECEQVIGQGFLQSSTCREKLVFRPFSNGESSVETNVVQKLSYATTSQRSFTGNDYRPTIETLLFKHEQKGEENPSRSVAEAEAILRELCEATQTGVSISVPRIFSTFVYKLKKLPLSMLRNFYLKTEKICPGNPKARKFFMDAVPIVATTDSAKLMHELIARGQISKSEINFWLTSLSFVNEPTADIIATFTPLLDGRHEQALLGISAMIHTFCKSNDCSQVPEVKNAVLKLFSNLGDNCFNYDDRKTIMTLKAISNIGAVFGKEDTLDACYRNPQLRMETRLAAIQAFRRISCDVSREELMKTYSNYDEEPELRIAAYLGVMTCPNAGVVDAVKEVLMNEKINHVNSFVWTHLHALSKSKHPQRQEIRDLFSNLYLLNKYNSDARKFSTAREATFFLESIDSGFHLDNHIVFSTDSYLPRTAMFNLTVDVFGKTCNLFQLDGRVEGLEHFVESFFGPNGYFPQKNIAKTLREKRSVSNNKISGFDGEFQAKSRFHQTPYGSLDLKIFGTTLYYDQFKQDNQDTPDINILDIVSKLAEEHEADFSRSFMFLDTTFTIPMTSGMPLRIAVNGTASVGLKYGGKVDVKSFEHVDIAGHIEPSGAIEIASLLTVDAGNVARSGLRVVGTMHSSTFLDGSLEIKDGEVIKAQLNMPRDRIDIFNIQSKMFLVHGQEEREQKVDKKGETDFKACTGSTTSKIFGVQLCSELRLPPYKANTALHPVNGPASFNIYIQKTDMKLKNYKFDAEYKLEMKNGALLRHGMISMNTPNSEVDRDVRMEIFVNHKDHTATLKVKTPVKRFGGSAKLVNEEALKKLLFEVTVDDKDYFALQTELRTISDKSSVTFMPSLEVRIPARRLAAMSGSVYMKHGQKYTAQLQIEDLTEKPILAKGNLESSKKNRYDGELSINSFVIDGTLKGYAQMGDSIASRVTAEYKFLEGKMNKINIMGKMRNLSANLLSKYTGLLNVQASLLPEWNTEVAFETMTTTGHIENTISLALGDGVRSRIHTIRLQEILRYEGNLKNNKVDGSLSLVYPEKNIDYAIQVNHENSESALKNTLIVQHESKEKFSSEVKLNINPGGPLSIEGDVKVKYPGREAGLNVNLIEISQKEYTGTLSCEWQQGRRASMVINYKDKSDMNKMKYEVDGAINFPLKNTISFSTTLGAQQGQYIGIAELNVGMEKYRVKGDYNVGNGMNHRVSGQLIFKNDVYGLEGALQHARNKLSCNVEIQMPRHRKVTARMEGRTSDFLSSGVFETMWDADRDASKRFGISGELRSHADGYETKVTVQIRRQTFTGLLSTSLKGEFWGPHWNTNNKIQVEWSPSERAVITFSTNSLFDRSQQQLNSQFDVSTPFDNYQNISLSLTHMYANQQWETELSTVLPYKNTINFSSSGKYSFIRTGATVETRANLQTSFAQMRETSFELSHDHGSKELTNKMQLMWGSGQRLGINLSGEMKPSTCRGSMKMTSSFKDFKDISVEVLHNHVPDNYKTKCEFQWAPRKKISMNFEGTTQLDGRRRICAVVLSGSSPFRDFENTVAKITYSSDGNTVNNEMELSWSNRKKILVSFSASKRVSMSHQNYECKLQITTPFKDYENSQIASSLEMNRNGYKCNIDAQLPHRSTASLNSQSKISGMNDIEFNAVIIGQLTRSMEPQRLSLDFVHKMQNSKMRTSLDSAFNKKKITLLLIGLTEASYNAREVEFSVTVNTPFPGFEEMKTDFSHSQKGYEFMTTAQGNINQLSGSLTHKLNVQDMLNFETTLEAKSSEIQNTKLTVIQVYNIGQLEHTSTLMWGRNKMNLNAQYVEKKNAKEITLKITSPFQNMREFETKASYEHENMDHRAQITFVLDRRHRASVSGAFRNYRWRNVNANLELTSSFSGNEFYSTSFNYDLTAPRKSIEMTHLWAVTNRKAITLKGNFLFSDSFTNVEVKVTTPYRNFKQLGFAAKLENSLPEISLNVVLEKDSQRIALDGKVFAKSDRSQVNFSLISPYQHVRRLMLMAKYNIKGDGIVGEITTDLNQNKYQVQGEYKLLYKAVEGKVSLVTPFEGYRTVNIQSKMNYEGSRRTGELSLKWENDIISVNSAFNSMRDGAEVTFDIQSSFTDYEDVHFKAQYQASNGFWKGGIKTIINRNYVYEGNTQVKYGDDKILELDTNIKLPGTRLRNFRLTTTIESIANSYSIKSVIVCNDKQTLFNAFLKAVKNQLFELSLQLETPYTNFDLFSLETIYRRREHQFNDVRLKITTPFNQMRTLDVFGELKTENSAHILTFTLKKDDKEMRIKGSATNKQFNPFSAQVEINAPFLGIQEVSGSADINIVSWNNEKYSIKVASPRFSHEFSFVLNQDDDGMDFQVKVDSSAFPRKGENFFTSIRTNYKNPSNIETEASLQLFGKVHYLNGELSNTGKATELQVKVESPWLSERKAELSASLARKRRGNNRGFDAKIGFTVLSSTHEVSVKYEGKDNRIITSMKIDSSMLRSSPLSAQAKYTNSNNRDFEASFNVLTSSESHNIVGNLKNYETEKFVQLKVECPMMELLNDFSVTGTLKHQNFESMDGSLAIGAKGKELRIAGKMKNEGLKNIEAFVTLNTPFEVLPMLRVDSQFQNDRFQTMDCNLQIETVNSNLGMTSKVIRTRDSGDISLMLHLPLKNYRTIQVLANAHYNADFTSADSRVTLTMPPGRYSVSGQYGISPQLLSGMIELELDGQKWSTSGKLDRNPAEISASLSYTNPRSERYSFGATYGDYDRRRFVASWFYTPQEEKYSMNCSLRYRDYQNFESTIRIETPFDRYRNMEASINQQLGNRYLSTNFEYSRNGRRGFMKVFHRESRNSITGTVQMGCPYTNLGDFKLSYSHLKKSREQECFLEMQLKGEKVFKAELLQFGDESSHAILDVPVLPMTVTADKKQLPNGIELNVKSDYRSRVVAFRTTYQNEDRQLLHDAMFAWDDKGDKRVSYDFKLGDTDSGKEVWGRLDMPVRSFMLKGNFTNSNRARSGGIKFYWDANRNLEKHIAIGVEHTDMSSGRKTSHRLVTKVEHPRLSREIIQSNTVTWGPSEFSVKSELSFSRQRHHNFLMQVKATDLSQHKRDSHFKGELILRHPATKLDVRLHGEAMNSKLESSLDLKMNSVDSDQVQHVKELKAALSKIMQQVEVKIRCDDDNGVILGRISTENGETGVFMEVKKNDVNSLATLLKINRRKRYFDLSVVNPEHTGMHVSAGYPGDTASFKISHSKRGSVVTDLNLFVGLEQSKILKSQLNWRPKMWEELRITTGENLRAFIRYVKEASCVKSRNIAEGFGKRLSQMSDLAYEQITPFANELSSDWEEMKNDGRIARSSFNRMYRRNEFYMMDIVRFYDDVKYTMREVMEGLSLGLEVLENIIVEYAEEFYYNMYYNYLDMREYLEKRCAEILHDVSEYYTKLQKDLARCARSCYKTFMKRVNAWYRTAEECVEGVIAKVEKVVRSYAPFLIDAYFVVKKTADGIRYYFYHMSDSIHNFFESNKYCVALKNYAASIAETIQAFKDYEYAESAQAFISRIYDAELIDNIINHPSVDYASSLANDALRKSVQIYYNTGMDTVVASVIKSATDYAQDLILKAAQELLAEMYQLGGKTKYDFAPHRGYIAFEISLPAPRNNLLEVFDLTSYPEYHKVMNIKKTVSTELYEDFCIWDYYYKVMKYFSPKYWLPTFTGHAMIAGNQHYITFDNLPYDFAGKCSYLLARDFVDGNFSVVINYGDNHQRKSLTVLTEGKKVDVAHDYKITINDVKTESPLMIERTVVMREGANIVIENEMKGFYIVCNFVHNYCSVSISGFYYGKTGGLFGTFNYEPTLDLMTPTRHIAGDLDTFASSWEVGQAACRNADNLATLPSNSYKVQTACKSLFSNSSSKFRACFKQVDPEPFMRMCVNDLSAVHEKEFEGAICESAAAYFLKCRVEGVPLKMPSQCVRCEKQDGTMMTEGEGLKFTRGDMMSAADVVLLIEEKECNRERVRYLPKLAQTIEDNYKHQGFKEVRFSVVAFGGDGIHSSPHVHTMDGQVSGPLRSLDTSLESLQFGDGPVNILESLRYAASLSFRPGTTKSFVLVKCSTCKSEEVKAEYGEMLRTLIDGDISLHLLMDQKFELKIGNKNLKGRKILGVDKSLAYTLKDVKDPRLSGDGDLMAQLRIPKDVCIPLAFEVDGSTFDVEYLMDTKKNTNKKFMDVMARRIVKSASKASSEWGMCCECIATVDGVGKSMCQKCVSAEIASMISAETSGINMISDSETSKKDIRVRKHKKRGLLL